jgi:hypothetical protein
LNSHEKIGFVLQKIGLGRHARSINYLTTQLLVCFCNGQAGSPFLFGRLSKAHAWSATVLTDELDAPRRSQIGGDPKRQKTQE